MPGGILFARVGWMKRYKGPQSDDERPIGGGGYNKDKLGHEIFNFLPSGERVLGYFQPQMQPKERRKAHPSTINLGKIEVGFDGNVLKNVLVVFVGRNPKLGGQYIIGWYRNATVHRFQQHFRTENSKKSRYYFVETRLGDEVLVPEPRRSFTVPGGKGGIGQANICYMYDDNDEEKEASGWIAEALEYVSSYQQEDAAMDPPSETDPEIDDLVGSTNRKSGRIPKQSSHPKSC